jgi:hypothetical protein
MTDKIDRFDDVAFDAEKERAANLEGHAMSPAENLKDEDGHQAMDPGHRAAVEKRLKRKLDARCSLFVLIYIMNYLDRNNIAAARLRGLQDDLNLDDTQYATCLSILYVGYILMQVRCDFIQRPY